MLLRVRRNFDHNGELWFEARAEEDIIIRFPSPRGTEVKVGDIISYDRGFLDGEAHIEVFSYKGHTVINAKASDSKDLRDRRIVLELFFEQSKSRIRLLATGEVETKGLFPGGDGPGESGFDALDGFMHYFKTLGKEWLSDKWEMAGPLDLRVSLVDWIESHAIPELKKAQAQSDAK
ncbi:MAG: hypothetical protein KGJ84_11140 [Elusimicrobia bacterium]|nr:hypothetical protein [Elusimicrobiota bacterium]